MALGVTNGVPSGSLPAVRADFGQQELVGPEEAQTAAVVDPLSRCGEDVEPFIDSFRCHGFERQWRNGALAPVRPQRVAQHEGAIDPTVFDRPERGCLQAVGEAPAVVGPSPHFGGGGEIDDRGVGVARFDGQDCTHFPDMRVEVLPVARELDDSLDQRVAGRPVVVGVPVEQGRAGGAEKARVDRIPVLPDQAIQGLKADRRCRSRDRSASADARRGPLPPIVIRAILVV